MADSTSLKSRMSFPSESKSTGDTTELPKSEEPKDGVESAQTDGAPSEQDNTALREPEYDVEVKLSDLQADPSNPLYSAKTFEQLNLSVLKDRLRSQPSN